MDNVPASPADVLQLPGLLVLLGVAVYAAGIVTGLRDLTLPKYRWAGVFLLVVAAFVGLQTVGRMFGPSGEFYRVMILTKPVLYAHYAALALPLLALLAVPAVETWFRRSQQDLR